MVPSTVRQREYTEQHGWHWQPPKKHDLAKISLGIRALGPVGPGSKGSEGAGRHPPVKGLSDPVIRPRYQPVGGAGLRFRTGFGAALVRVTMMI